MTAPRWIRVGEAAELLGVSDQTCYRMAEARRITYRRDEVTGSWRFDRQSIAAHVRWRTVASLRSKERSA